MSKLKIGIIGAGGISGTHVPHLAARSDVELSIVSDINPDAAQTFAAKHRFARHGADYRELIAAVDAVLVCVPTHLHASLAIDALRAGKPVFCEKPIARTLDQASAMAAASQQGGAPLQIGFVRRFDEEWGTWRDAVLADKIGRPVVWRQLMANAGPGGAWFVNEQMGGGPFLDGCIHNIDFALYTFGPAEWVFAHLRSLNPVHTALDTGTATIHFRSGDELLLAWSWGVPPGCNGDRAFDLLGPLGVITQPPADDANPNQRRYFINQGSSGEDAWYPSNAIQQAFKAQMDEFIEVARGDKAPRAGSHEGIQSLRVALAILESGRSAQVVRV